MTHGQHYALHALVNVHLREDDLLNPPLLVGDNEEMGGCAWDVDFPKLQWYSLAYRHLLDEQARYLPIPHDLHVEGMDRSIFTKRGAGEDIIADVVLSLFLGIASHLGACRLENRVGGKQTDFRLRFDLQNGLFREDSDN